MRLFKGPSHAGSKLRTLLSGDDGAVVSLNLPISFRGLSGGVIFVDEHYPAEILHELRCEAPTVISYAFIWRVIVEHLLTYKMFRNFCD